MKSPAEKYNESLYNSWHGMLRRCYQKDFKFYRNYGGRGIKVASRWHLYKNFAHDMSPSWEKGLTLERVDNNGDYSPKNCKWATRLEQVNNRRNTTHITYKGEIKTLTQWAISLGLKGSTVRQRYYVYRWPIEKVLS